MLNNNSPVVLPPGRGNLAGSGLELASEIDYDSAYVLRRADVLARLAISEPHLHWLVAEGYYPWPFPYGPKLRGWLESTNDAWITWRMHVRDEQTRPQGPVHFEPWTPEMDLIVPPRSGLCLLREAEVLSRVRFGSTALWDKVRAREFPAPVAIGPRGKRWVLHEVSDWIREQHERRCEENPGYRFLTQRLDAIRPQKRSPDSDGGSRPRRLRNAERSKASKKAS